MNNIDQEYGEYYSSLACSVVELDINVQGRGKGIGFGTKDK